MFISKKNPDLKFKSATPFLSGDDFGYKICDFDLISWEKIISPDGQILSGSDFYGYPELFADENGNEVYLTVDSESFPAYALEFYEGVNEWSYTFRLFTRVF